MPCPSPVHATWSSAGLVVVAVAAAGGGLWPQDRWRQPDRPDHDEQLRFMWAMAGQESGWDYYARNSSSGAFGKYQIMPFNWPVWAAQYLGDGRADQTPFNQEKVAYGKLRDLYGWLGSWKRVAYWWLTGRTDRNEKRWSGYATGYVRQHHAAAQEGAQRAARDAAQDELARRAGAIGAGRASEQLLRLAVGGRPWPDRGQLRDGQVLKVQGRHRTDGRAALDPGRHRRRAAGLAQTAHARCRHTSPPRPRRWADVKDEGRHAAATDGWYVLGRADPAAT